MDINQSTDNILYRVRHSLAHIMAAAVLDLRPGSKLGFGPPIADGFYYDFILSAPITEEDFPAIENKMRKIIKNKESFTREDLPKEQAFALLDKMGEPYKKEYAEELFVTKNLKNLSFFKTGEFVDMCEGPHVATTQELPLNGFKLKNLAGAYWRGDSKNTMMTRIYAWAFLSKEELDKHIKAYNLALESDHKKLGRYLDIFEIDDTVGKGLPLWLPNGTIIRDELEKFMKELEFKWDYKRVTTPIMAKTDLYYQTGHLPYYAAHMFPMMELKEDNKLVKETYCLRPMICPHHHKIYAARKRSYRDLPLRLAEYGGVYRFEDSGALAGLLRVRGMCMNDAHIYCTEQQIKQEFLNVMLLHQEAYKVLGINSYYVRFSTWDPNDPKGKEKYVNNPRAWEWSQKMVYEAMLDSGLPFVEGKGEAAFYGPKIDVQFTTVTGREETASTNQLDFAVPERLNLTYIGADNKEHHPYVLHRAPLGTHERLVAFLIELYAGAFPTWLAPIQIFIITVSDKFNEYAHKIKQQLKIKMLRVELDDSSDTIGKKIRNATKKKIPNILIIGEKEEINQTVTWRRYKHEEQLTLSVLDFEKIILTQVQNRTTS